MPTLTAPNSNGTSFFYPKLKASLSLAMLMPLIASAADATSPNVNEENKTSWGLGVAAISFQQPYKNIDRNNLVIPLIYIENDWLQVFGLGAEIKLPSIDFSTTQKIDFRIATRFDMSGYESSDSNALRGMKERKNSFMAGGKAIWHNEFADISAEWLADVSGNSDGQIASFGVEKTLHYGQHIILTPRLITSWMNDKYVDYYYGVNDSEVRFNRAAYEGKSGFNTTIGTRATYLLDRKQSLFLDLSLTKFSKEIEDSPIVDRSSGNRIGLGYMYRF